MRRLGSAGTLFVLLLVSGATATAQEEQTAAGGFVSGGSLAEPRFGHTATVLTNGRILVAGGYADGALKSAETWDPATSTFTPAGSMADGRRFHTATALPDGRILLVGGVGGKRERALASAET